MQKQNSSDIPSVESVRKFLKDWGGDGWSILEADALTKGYGFPEAWAKRLVHNHRSAGGKYDITDNEGRPVKTLEGIHTLTVLELLAQQFNVSTRSFFGRGSQARAYTDGIWNAIGKEE